MFNPHSSALVNFNFQPLEVVSRYRDPQLQAAEKKMNLRNSSHYFHQCNILSGLSSLNGLTTKPASANIVLCNNYDISCIMLPCAMYNVTCITFTNVIFILNLIFIAQGISV